ncbi:uncharacterized protein LOC118813467 isoform X3 [Colossoma macropomum]|uniref:uncharacterized protein LOC118813467 isoform X3 n=1 Tax=Colossoma macropomum TaxID=42526 RepID=UPI00186522A0|nr:uncharacterized protein LOC118813467 isoform X3 [Colossoma macropomum]
MNRVCVYMCLCLMVFSNKRRNEMERELERSLSEKSFSYRICADKSVDDIWKKNKMRLHKILNAYMEEEEQQNEARLKAEGRKKRRERRSRQRN